jgi:hypothetical protein
MAGALEGLKVLDLSRVLAGASWTGKEAAGCVCFDRATRSVTEPAETPTAHLMHPRRFGEHPREALAEPGCGVGPISGLRTQRVV